MLFFHHKKTSKELFIWFIAEIIKTIFVASFLTFIIFFILEYFKTGLITNYLNINLILIIYLISAIILALSIKDEIQLSSKKIGLFRILFFIILAFLTAILIFNIIDSEKISLVLGPISGLAIFLILILISKFPFSRE